MIAYHGSHDPDLKEIRIGGAWNIFDGLFASEMRTVSACFGEFTYKLEAESWLTSYELNYEIEGAWEIALELCGGNEQKAEAIMTAGCQCDGEDGWELQRLRGRLCAKLGFDAIEMEDENGTVWLFVGGTIERV